MKKSEDDWFGLLSDEAKADVIKTRIKEEEQTKRILVEEKEKSQRNLYDSDGYHTVRIALSIGLILFIITASLCTCDYIQHMNPNSSAVPNSTTSISK